MKAVMMQAVGGPEVLQVIEVPKPIPATGQVLIRTQAMGVGMVDVLIRTGTYKWMPPLPASPGCDLTGVVETVGEGAASASEWAVGDHVLLTSRDLPARGGCYSEYIAVPASAVHRLPAHVDFIEAAGLSNYQVANALLSDAVGVGVKTLFISGIAGGVGSALTDLAKCMGHTVIGTASSAEKIAFAKSVGADHVINYRTDNVLEAVLQFTAGKGVDVVLDHIGGVNFYDNLKLLAPFGMLVSFNAFGAQPHGSLLDELRKDEHYGKAVRCFSFHSYDTQPVRRRELMREVIKLLGEGRIKPRIAISLPMAQAAEAHRMIEAAQGLGKIVLIPGNA